MVLQKLVAAMPVLTAEVQYFLDSVNLQAAEQEQITDLLTATEQFEGLHECKQVYAVLNSLN